MDTLGGLERRSGVLLDLGRGLLLQTVGLGRLGPGGVGLGPSAAAAAGGKGDECGDDGEAGDTAGGGCHGKLLLRQGNAGQARVPHDLVCNRSANSRTRAAGRPGPSCSDPLRRRSLPGGAPPALRSSPRSYAPFVPHRRGQRPGDPGAIGSAVGRGRDPPQRGVVRSDGTATPISSSRSSTKEKPPGADEQCRAAPTDGVVQHSCTERPRRPWCGTRASASAEVSRSQA